MLFLDLALAQATDYSRSNYTCTRFLNCLRERERENGGRKSEIMGERESK